jgi:hypothetical protein
MNSRPFIPSPDAVHLYLPFLKQALTGCCCRTGPSRVLPAIIDAWPVVVGIWLPDRHLSLLGKYNFDAKN